MSAFFVQEGVIDDIIATYKPMHMSGDDRANEFGQMLLTMNLYALSQRYVLGLGERKEYLAVIQGYEYQEPKTSEAQQLKSLNCFLYQCMEGCTPEALDIYPKLKKHSEFLTEALVKGRQKLSFGEYRPHVEGYDDADWDRFRGAP